MIGKKTDNLHKDLTKLKNLKEIQDIKKQLREVGI